MSVLQSFIYVLLIIYSCNNILGVHCALCTVHSICVQHKATLLRSNGRKLNNIWDPTEFLAIINDKLNLKFGKYLEETIVVDLVIRS